MAVFEFAESWRVAAPPSAVRDVLVDLERYPEWWAQVRAVASLGPEEAWVRCRSVLPYTLDLRLRAVSRDLPTLEVELSGDLHGWVRWSLAPAGGGTWMDYRQEVTLTSAVRLLAPAAGPLLRWNHHRMMAGCRRGLEGRLAGRSHRRSR